MNADTGMEFFEQAHPLWRFSPYLWGRIRVLTGLARDICDDLDAAFSSSIQVEELAHAEACLWLWCLGAYEMVRTMTQAGSCFSSRLQTSLQELKRELAEVRMPAAKMELRGITVPVTSSRAPADIDVESRDLLVGNPSRPVSARALLARFEAVINSIEPQDVLDRHESGYAKTAV